MTGFGKFLAATIVSFFLMIGALGSDHPTFLIALALLVWILFVWSISSGSSKRNRERDEQIRLFNSFIKSKGKF
ncbi:hypothetical protein SAMN05421827_12828 [Pedobacter terrae]|uniref:Uncharacterized protein n=1 Tax=Pedobacter terrae TaxID=405671 RepID=A0A1G8D6P2_9SPHI|nr:hypothetical protein SAMN05421827_12828 [Pedobacter terrae]